MHGTRFAVDDVGLDLKCEMFAVNEKSKTWRTSVATIDEKHLREKKQLEEFDSRVYSS